MNPWTLLFIAICIELIGTGVLKASDGLSKILPSILVVISYLSAFFLLAVAMRSLPVGIAYAVWAGAGTIGAMFIGRLFFNESIGTYQISGTFFIVLGIFLLNQLSLVNLFHMIRGN